MLTTHILILQSKRSVHSQSFKDNVTCGLSTPRTKRYQFSLTLNFLRRVIPVVLGQKHKAVYTYIHEHNNITISSTI